MNFTGTRWRLLIAAIAVLTVQSVFSKQVDTTEVQDRIHWCKGQPFSCATIANINAKLQEIADILHWNVTYKDNVFNDDIRMTPRMSDSFLEAARRSVKRRRKRKLQRFDYFVAKWKLPIPYSFLQSNISKSDKDVIRSAMHHWEENTCIRFVEKNYTRSPLSKRYNWEPHIKFTTGYGCTSYIGRISPAIQPIELAPTCLSQGIAVPVHEIGHTLGLWHEHQRADRNNHVRILKENLAQSPTSYHSFINQGNTNDLVPYDYGSVMHYFAYANSFNGKITVEPRNKLYMDTVGQKHGLSFLDSKIINMAYCADACHSSNVRLTCREHGYPDPNDCSKCRCPDGFAGKECEKVASSVNAKCGGFVKLESSVKKYVSSPGYDDGSFYEEQTACSWLVEAPANHRVVVEFVGPRFGLLCGSGGDGVHCWHYVEIRYMADHSNTGPRFCCYKRPKVKLRSEGRRVLVLLRSNYSYPFTRRNGFKLRVHAEPDTGLKPGLVETVVKELSSSSPPSTTTTTTLPLPSSLPSGEVIDVAFLLDSSGGVGRNNWQRHVLGFAREVARSFTLGDAHAQFGAVAFGWRAKLAVPLKKSREYTRVLDRALADIAWIQGFSNATGGLRIIADDFFDSSRGGRPNVKKLIVLVTDGPLERSSDRKRASIAAELRNSGVDILLVTVGKALSTKQIEDIVSTPSTFYLIKAPGFGKLLSLVPDVVSRIATLAVTSTTHSTTRTTKTTTTPTLTTTMTTTPATTTATTTTALPATTKTTTTTTTAETKSTTAKATTTTTTVTATSTTITSQAHTTNRASEHSADLLDVVFVLDSSGSVGASNWRKLLTFVKDVIAGFALGDGGARIGIVTYSLHAYLDVQLGAFADRDDLYRRIDALKWLDSWSNTAAGIRAMRQLAFGAARDRQEAPNVCVLVTDGPSNYNKSLTVPEAVAAKRDGITMFVIGVTNVDISEIHGMASVPRLDHELFLNTFGMLQRHVPNVREKLHNMAAIAPLNATSIAPTTATTATTTTTTLTTMTTTTSPTTPTTTTTTTTPTTTTTTTTSPTTSTAQRSTPSSRTTKTKTTTAPLVDRVYSWSCDFENDKNGGVLCGMTQSLSDQFDWTRMNKSTPSSETGPDRAYSGTYYIYIEASNPRKDGDEATIYTPTMRKGNYCLTFGLSMYGFHVNKIEVMVVSPSEDVVWHRQGNRGKGWTIEKVSLHLKEDSKIAFRGVRGEEFSGDIALDDIRLTAGAC